MPFVPISYDTTSNLNVGRVVFYHGYASLTKNATCYLIVCYC